MMSKTVCGLHKVAWLLLIVGGLNWLLVGLFEFDLVVTLFGAWPIVVKSVYVLVGLSAAYMLSMSKCGKDGRCETKPPSGGAPSQPQA